MMRQNVVNLLRNAASCLHGTGYNSDLIQLSKNLRELAERTAKGDATALTEFLDLYCLTVDEKVNHG